MIEQIKVIIMNTEKTISSGMTLYEISKSYQKEFRFPIVLAKVNGIYQELNEVITKPCNIDFFDLLDSYTNKVYVSGLIYLTIYSFKELFGEKADIKVEHAIDKGLYIETNIEIDENSVTLLKEKMQEVINSRMDITKVTINRLDAIDYFKRMDDDAKKGIMKYNSSSNINLYRLGYLYNYFYSLMPINTECLGHFNLTYLNSNGLILTFPTKYSGGKIKKYQHHPQIFEIFREYYTWAKIMNIENVTQLNEIVSKGNIEDLIRIDETLQSMRLLEIARDIFSRKNKVKIILVAGPSSSGKTTTCNKLSMYLRSFGLNPVMLSMDDFFLDHKDKPRNEKGELDFESIYALDLKLFDEQIKRLLDGEEVIAPIFNFVTGEKSFKKALKLQENDFLIIEGIHGLNNDILNNIDQSKKYKIYISALTELKIDKHNRISTTDNRLLRRIVRDNKTRGTSIEQTLEQWQEVRIGEEQFVFPYQDEADATINSALIYELGVLRTYAEPLLYSVKSDSPHYNDVVRLLKFLQLFLTIPSESIPDDSILREFIGGSCFK